MEQRKNAMQCLQGLVEKGTLKEAHLEEHFKSLLLILLETLGDTNVSVFVFFFTFCFLNYQVTVVCKKTLTLEGVTKSL